MPYDRELLLSGVKRNAVLELWEVQRYGADSYGDADYVCVYGLRPNDWYAKGIRLLGRTAVECTRDVLADAIGRDVASVAAAASPVRTLVVDPFVGSGNTLYWLLRHLPDSHGIGFELDARVLALTLRNLASLGLPIDVSEADYRTGLSSVSAGVDELIVVFIAPPWGVALDPASGLDLSRTQPPVGEIVEMLRSKFALSRMLCAVQVFERMNADALSDLRARFDWSDIRLYGMNAISRNHGVLLGTIGWRPKSSA